MQGPARDCEAAPTAVELSVICGTLVLVVGAAVIASGVYLYWRSTKGYNPFAFVGLLVSIPTLVVGGVQALCALLFLVRSRFARGAILGGAAFGLVVGVFLLPFWLWFMSGAFRRMSSEAGWVFGVSLWLVWMAVHTGAFVSGRHTSVGNWVRAKEFREKTRQEAEKKGD